MLVKPARRAPLSLSRHAALGGRVARLAVTWPGLAALLSALAVWFGAPPSAPHTPHQVTAGNWTPPLPELRPAPQPAPGVPLPAAPPPNVVPLWMACALGGALHLAWTSPASPPDLATLGRWQLDG